MSQLWPVVLGLVLGLWFPLTLVLATRNPGEPGRRGRPRDRLAVLDAFCTAVVGVIMAWIFLPWDTIPPLLWAVPVAITVYGTVMAFRAWPLLDWVAPGRRRIVAAAGSLIGIAITGAVAWLVFA